MFKEGDRVKVAQLIKDEPCSDIDILLNQIGTVVDPAVPDKDDDGNDVTRVQIVLDEPVDTGYEPHRFSCDFMFKPEELEKV